MIILKKILFAVLLLAVCLCAGCVLSAAVILDGSDDSVPKEEIFEYVTPNTEVLSAFPYNEYRKITDDEARLSFIRDALGDDTIVKSVYRYNPSVLDFYCGGLGNVTSSTYCGFYYSKEDAPFAQEFESEAQFTQTSDNAYEWESEDRQKSIRTERIQPNWFWYYLRWD